METPRAPYATHKKDLATLCPGSPSTTAQQSVLEGLSFSIEVTAVGLERETLMFALRMSFQLLAAPRCFLAAACLAILLGLPLTGNTSSYQVGGWCKISKLLINIPGGTMLSGRYVIVQMDNGATTPINLNEVKAFGRLADAGEMKQKVHDLSNLISRSFANLQTPAPFSTTLH